jgi:hypothetical protein
MSNNVNITSGGIRKLLAKYNEAQAVAEYIWNGFDAKANIVNLNFESGLLGRLDMLEVVDNGYGIKFDQIESKFNPFYESEKAIEISAPVHTSLMHGKNGVGRLTFFTFAHSARWETTFQTGKALESCSINIEQANLKNYIPKKLEKSVSDTTGTKVTFTNLQISDSDLEVNIIPFLINEFCWFLELNSSKGYKIAINDEPLDYSINIAELDGTIEFVYDKTNTTFKCKFIQWKNPLHKELSKYYFLNSSGDEVYKDFTTLNKKGDEFYHSVYIQSDFFDNFNTNAKTPENQSLLFGKARSSPEYKFLIRKVNEYVRAKRKPYLRTFATRLVEKYEQDGILPSYKNEWEAKYKKPQLEETLIGLYEAEPKLFTNLNTNQKKTFVRLLDLLLDSNERDNLLAIIDEVVELEPEEREDLAKLFETTSLNRIIETIKLIEDRYKIYYQLRDVVFETSLEANEVDHLQKIIESHYWIFGEQFNLVTAAEPKFEEALRRYIYHLTENDQTTEIDHQHKLKEMDIFACRQNILADRIENIVVELKHPSINLGMEQYNQVDKYLQVILSRPEFNANNMYWEFYLIGNKFNTSGYIDRQIITNKNHGESGLVLSIHDGRVKFFVKKWSEIFADFEIRHRHIDSKLKLERERLTNEMTSADEIVVNLQDNLATQPQQVYIRPK